MAFSLPPQLKKLGHEIAVITPLYPCVQERFGEQLNKKTELSVWLNGAAYPCGLYWTELNGVIVWFVENEAFFHRPRLYGYDDDKKRFAWFCRAVIEVLFQLDFVPQILHCNDWETALAILYLKNDQASKQFTPFTTSPIRASSELMSWRTPSACLGAGTMAVWATCTKAGRM